MSVASFSPVTASHEWLWPHYDYVRDLATRFARQYGHLEQADLFSDRALEALMNLEFDPARGARPKTIIYRIVHDCVVTEIRREQSKARAILKIVAATAPSVNVQSQIIARDHLRYVFQRALGRSKPVVRRRALLALRAGKVCLSLAIIGIPVAMFVLVSGMSRTQKQAQKQTTSWFAARFGTQGASPPRLEFIPYEWEFEFHGYFSAPMRMSLAHPRDVPNASAPQEAPGAEIPTRRLAGPAHIGAHPPSLRIVRMALVLGDSRGEPLRLSLPISGAESCTGPLELTLPSPTLPDAHYDSVLFGRTHAAGVEVTSPDEDDHGRWKFDGSGYIGYSHVPLRMSRVRPGAGSWIEAPKPACTATAFGPRRLKLDFGLSPASQISAVVSDWE